MPGSNEAHPHTSIDDNRLLREGITAMINAQKDMRVVGVSGGSNDVLARIRQTMPHVLLLDLGLRNLNVLQIVASVANEVPDVKIIAMGIIPLQSDVVDFVEAGASGFTTKDTSKRDFLGTIRSVAGGTKVLPPSLTSSLFSIVVNHALQKGRGTPYNAIRLTQRERDITGLIADGLSNKEIGARLNIATFTVKSHVHNILEKLALHSRLQISAYLHTED